MKIVIAPDSYKECLSALQVATFIELGFREVFPHADYVKVPVADGGEGTVEAMVEATGGQRIAVTVKGPLGEPVEAFYGLTGDGSTAVIEMATASGLGLVPPEKRNPLKTTSYGTGELIRSALDAGARKFILGIGGSATNEGGAGMLQALGARLAPTLRAGDVILLSGDMGAGKSEFARGVARGLGIACAVPSPSFTILNVYEEGRVPLYHFDWYRIGDESELTDMGLDEYIGGNGVTLIEWHERASDLLPETALEVRLTPLENGAREIALIPRGEWENTHDHPGN